MPEGQNSNKTFEIKDCALAALATGKKSQNLKELNRNIGEVESGSLYYHFWGGLLQPRFDDPEYNNDFASWIRHTLHDKVLAEQIGIIDPTEYPDLEELRDRLHEIIEARLDELQHLAWCKIDEQFHFITSQIVVFDTKKTIYKAEDLVDAIPNMTSSSIFYHFIDSRRRTYGNIDDFSTWLYGFEGKYNELIHLLSNIDPFFSSLTELRSQLSNIVTNYFMESR